MCEQTQKNARTKSHTKFKQYNKNVLKKYDGDARLIILWKSQNDAIRWLVVQNRANVQRKRGKTCANEKSFRACKQNFLKKHSNVQYKHGPMTITFQ